MQCIANLLNAKNKWAKHDVTPSTLSERYNDYLSAIHYFLIFCSPHSKYLSSPPVFSGVRVTRSYFYV